MLWLLSAAMPARSDESHPQEKLKHDSSDEHDAGADRRAVIAPQSIKPQNLPHETDNQSANGQHKVEKSLWDGWKRDPTAVFTAIIAFFTILLALAAGWQTAIVRATARRQLRAYLFIDNAGITNVADPPQPVPEGQPLPQGAIRWRDSGPIATLNLKNAGQTPAFNVVHFANIHVQEYPLTNPLPPFPAANQHTTKFMIGPGSLSIKHLVLPIQLTPQEINDLRTARTAIYVYGHIEYLDAFRKKRFTNYRMRHNGLTGNVGVIGELTGSDQGNDAN